MRLLTFNQLKPEKGIDYSRIHLVRMVRAGSFPPPLRMGGPGKRSNVRWLESEIDSWLASRPRAWVAPSAAP